MTNVEFLTLDSIILLVIAVLFNYVQMGSITVGTMMALSVITFVMALIEYREAKEVELDRELRN